MSVKAPLVTHAAFPEPLRRGSLGGVLSLRPELFDVPGAALRADACEATVRREFGGVSWGCGDPVRARADVAWEGGGCRVFAWILRDAPSSCRSRAHCRSCRTACESA